MILHQHDGKLICALQSNDMVLVGYAAAGIYGDHEDATLVTLSHGPHHMDNDVEILIPQRAWAGLLARIATEHTGRFLIE